MKISLPTSVRLLLPSLSRQGNLMARLAVLTVMSSLAEYAFPLLTLVLVDKVIPRKQLSLLDIYAAGTLALVISKWLATFFANLVAMAFSGRVLLSVQLAILKSLRIRSFSSFWSISPGTIISHLTTGVMSLEPLVGEPIVNLIRTISSFLLGVAIVAKFDPQVAYATLACGSLILVIRKLFGKHVAERSKIVEAANARVVDCLNEAIYGLYTSYLLGRHGHEMRRVGSALIDTYRARLLSWRQSSLRRTCEGAVGNVYLLFFIWSGGRRVMNGHLSLGEFTAISTFISNLSGSMYVLLSIASAAFDTGTIAQTLLELSTVPRTHHIGSEVESNAGYKSDISVSLSRVSFSYGTERPILSSFDLEVRRNQIVGIVAPSGSGKTTLVNLIAGVYQPSEGSIVVCGKNVKDMTASMMRAYVGVVPQDIYIFRRSILDNIRYAKPDASLAEVKRVACMCQLHEFIDGLRNGYDSIIGEGLGGLSRGQRQRIGIARAALLDPQVLVLDEATASLDLKTEESLLQSLEEFMKSRTTILVSHSERTLRIADCIIYLQECSRPACSDVSICGYRDRARPAQCAADSR